jgi:hypothetical protein
VTRTLGRGGGERRARLREASAALCRLLRGIVVFMHIPAGAVYVFLLVRFVNKYLVSRDGLWVLV